MSEKSDKLAIRLIAIITKLNNGEKLNVKELSTEFGTSEKTITTDLNKRLVQFLPIERKKNYYFLESASIGKLDFNDIRNFANLSGIKELYPSLSDELLSDVLNAKMAKACLVKSGTYENLSSKTDTFELLRNAITTNYKIAFTYNDKKRYVNPYKLVNTNNIWYLVADEEGVLKTYTFSKIKNLLEEKETFLPQNEFLEIINKNQANWFSQNSISVILEIDAEVSEYFLRRELLPNQNILRYTNKSIILKTTVSYDEEILKIVRYWMPHIQIQEPEYLREKLFQSLEMFMKRS